MDESLELIQLVAFAYERWRTGMLRLEDLTDEELKRLTTDFEQLRDRHARPGQGVTQNDRPEPEEDTMKRRVQD
jgi:hypothetical protein